MAQAEEATTVEALKLKLEIAQTERATAEARTREAELKAQAPAAPVASAPKALPKRFLLPGDFADVFSGDLFPKGGAGVQGDVLWVGSPPRRAAAHRPLLYGM